MPLFPKASTSEALPFFNSASPWASDADDLKALFAVPETAAVTTRTTTIEGFPDDERIHQVSFFSDGQSSINCYGYSPFPLSSYLDWLKPILLDSATLPKLTIVSVTGSLEETTSALAQIVAWATEINKSSSVPRPIAVEFNASCPNIVGHPPPAYHLEPLIELLTALANGATEEIKVGVKLPVYTFQDQFDNVIKALEAVAPLCKNGKDHPISFLTSTNTLGTGLVFGEQTTTSVEKGKATLGVGKGSEFALPGGFGGLAGDAVHQISLGNVYKITQGVKASSEPKLATITIIGVGGVKDKASVARMRAAGADVVACATALGREGLAIFKKL